MINKIVKKNLNANKSSIIPFILANSVIYAVLFVFYTLTKNEYVLMRNKNLTSMMNFGAIVTSFIAVIFTLYSQRFIIKSRYRELSLYQVLGLEKKHIIQMLARESMFIFSGASILSIITGYAMGVISFLFLKKTLNITLEAFNLFDFNIGALIKTIIILWIGFFLNIIINIYTISKKSPSELIKYEREAEKEPKVNFLFLLFGITTLGTGYAIALIIDDPILTLLWLFVAIALVISGTYCLYTSISIFVLSMQRKNKKYYYKKENFLSVSNLLFRMKTNGVSLATITILCTGVILSLAVSYTLGQSMQKMKMDYDYELYCSIEDYRSSKEQVENKIKEIDEKLDKQISRSYFIKYDTAVSVSEDGEIKLKENVYEGFNKNMSIFTLTTKEFYEKAFDVKLDNLLDNEIYYTATNRSTSRNLDFDKIKILGQTYNTKQIEYKSSNNISIDTIFIVVKDYETFQKIIAETIFEYKKNMMSGGINIKIMIDELEKDLSEYLKKFADENSMEYYSQKDMWEFVQEFSGGFFFLGVLISIVFTIITSLVLYYKQVAEAEEDKCNYNILKKLGVSESVAAKTIKRQMKSVFLMPIIVAIIHNIIASFIITKLLMLFGENSYFAYFKNLMIVAILFTIIYLLIYNIAQKSYRQIVWNE